MKPGFGEDIRSWEPPHCLPPVTVLEQKLSSIAEKDTQSSLLNVPTLHETLRKKDSNEDTPASPGGKAGSAPSFSLPATPQKALEGTGSFLCIIFIPYVLYLIRKLIF